MDADPLCRMDATGGAYAALLGPGILWISLHCIGMCGPVMAAIGFGRELGWGRRLALLAAYQGGRMVVLGGLGAALAWGGSALFATLPAIGWAIGGLLACAFLIAALMTAGVLPAGSGTWAATIAGRLAAAARSQGAGAAGAFRLGLVLALMPCMLVAWTLGLAAGTRDPLHGALLPTLLVLLTTPALALAIAVPAWWGGMRRRGQAVARWAAVAALLTGSLWMALRTLADAGVIAHRTIAGVPLW